MQQKSRCIYCGSSDIGKGCRYGPHGVHFHPNDSTKCAYCKSPNFGKGCKINPTSDLHIHGINYNTMFKENLNGFLHSSVLLKELQKDYTEFLCYKLGIIDNKGNKIKQPLTEQEIASYTTSVKTILKLKRHLGSKIDLIQMQEDLTSSTNLVNESLELHKKTLIYQEQINEAINHLYEIFENAHKDGLPLETIQKLIKA
jgi:hypothetical protein